MDRASEKEKARERRRRSILIKNRWYETLKQCHGYNERSYLYVLYKDKIFEWLEAQSHAYNHRRSCSCFMCGNPRKYRNEITMQERKFLYTMSEQLEEASIKHNI